MNGKKVFNPVSACRIQFSKDFTFDDLRKVIPYLEKLGIRTIYASPVFKAVAGSEHGYDVTDAGQINPELGSIDDLRALKRELENRSMGWLQDIVPNHQAFDPQNVWIADIFRYGERSRYYRYFDIDWDHWDPDLKNRVMLPFFGDPLMDLLEKGELKIGFTSEGFVLVYFDKAFPLSIQSWHTVLNVAGTAGLDKAVKTIGDRDSHNLVGIFGKLYHDDREIQSLVENSIRILNEDKEKLRDLISEQFYLPAFWKESERRINYRRFFTINGLISLRMEDPEVFDSYHELTDQLVKEGIFDGLRIDHIDGLLSPGQYLNRLRHLTGSETYIVVEKILERDEKLKPGWPVQGNTGYDFGSMVNNLLINENNGKVFNDIYVTWNDKHPGYNKLIYDKKHFIIFSRMNGDLQNLLHQFLKIPGLPLPLPDNSRLAEAIAEFLIQCPVYKMYPGFGPFNQDMRDFIRSVFQKASDHKPDLLPEFGLLQDIFLYEGQDENCRNAGRDFFLRCMQFTGPLMAKGLEDTAYYSYAFFIAQNEVGDSPDYFGIRTKAFHDQMRERLREFPLTLNATSTHDSKRGGDSRARLAVISDIPGIWKQYVIKWKMFGEQIREGNSGIPTLNDEYFIYQTLVGSYPPALEHDKEYLDRLTAAILKSIREAKDNTSWTSPDEDYESRTLEFTGKLLEHDGFMKSFRSFLKIIIDPGMISSLSQVLLRNTSPGVPDLYRGCETWNFSFVDPDNRLPVDFINLSESLDEIIGLFTRDKRTVYETLWKERVNGKIKLWLTWLTLQERKADPDFFRTAAYIPLEVKGTYKDRVMAFMRYRLRQWYFVAVPLRFTDLLAESAGGFGEIDWGSTRAELPVLHPSEWENLVNGEIVEPGKSIHFRDIFRDSSVGFLKARIQETSRKAGILLHITSLPGKYGTGDLGNPAFDFAGFLQRNGQSYWQILPLNYVGKETAYSPYSCLSAFAGNILLINPELLKDAGLVSSDDIGVGFEDDADEARFEEAEAYRVRLLKKAWRVFNDSEMPVLAMAFEEFCKKESFWLEDFAMFILFREMFEKKTWNEWPEDIRDRLPESLAVYREKYRDQLDEIKFAQFLFFEQWFALKRYANDIGVKIIGDLPFYVGFDSADVWANPHLFRLGPDKSMEKIAGVPPDYFNDEGQLWNMPVYRWDLMKQYGYTWWKQRLGKNLELYDVVRIDHFRAFADYWQVPAGEPTAVNGEWVAGPGRDFFNSIRKEFPAMPFIAEDLGDVNQGVYDLRDQFDFPGMVVLQFAFGGNIAASVHAPHNHRKNSIVYTGTHDNNTLKGWYRHELKQKSRRQLRRYAGRRINGRNCNAELIRMAFMSPALTAIIPMQDYLGLDQHARMNRPSTQTGNWTWRMGEEDILPSVEKMIQEYTLEYGRLG